MVEMTKQAQRAAAALLPRCENAVEYLLFGKGSLRRRLCDGYRDYLVPLQPREFPSAELRKALGEIQSAMSAYSMGNALDAKHGRIEAAAHKMPGARARSVARNVFRLYTGLVDVAIHGLEELD